MIGFENAQEYLDNHWTLDRMHSPAGHKDRENLLARFARVSQILGKPLDQIKLLRSANQQFNAPVRFYDITQILVRMQELSRKSEEQPYVNKYGRPRDLGEIITYSKAGKNLVAVFGDSYDGSSLAI